MATKNYLSSTGSWAKHAAVIAVFGAMAALLGSCGGSGVASTTAATPPVIPLAVLPNAADVFADVPVSFSVSGGTAPYSLASSNTVAVPTPSLSGTSFTVAAKNVNADTTVTLTVRDSLGATTPVALSVRPTTLNNTVTVTPAAQTGSGCAGLCSGGDAKVVVTAVVNGIKLTNRPIRFDVFQGDFRLVTPGTNVLVTSLVINTDENGEAAARIQVLVTAPTQVATISSTDTVTGLVRRTNFIVVQQTNGAGILSILPSGPVTFTAGKAPTGQPAQCPFGAIVDHYIYGGTPPYLVVSPLPTYLSVFPSVVSTNGGSYRVTQSGCGTASIIVRDATNRVVESSSVISVAGEAGDTPPAAVPASLTVTPTALAVGCGQTGTVALTGSGTYTATVSTAGVPPAAFTIAPLAGAIPGTISFTRNTSVPPAPAITSPTTIVVNVVGASAIPVTITVPATCP